MSRYELDPLPEFEGTHRIAVGWDQPLCTFFATVFLTDPDAGDQAAEVLWIGATFREISDHEIVIKAVQPYAVIPDDLAFNLYGDAN